jgi:F-type H+-transporting ATPase subunit gamma
MANPLELRRRIRSVENTRQITRAMQLVAASRMRRAQEAADAARPYAREVLEMMHQLVAATGDDLLPPLLRARPVERSAYVVMTTNRGLCGALNSNVVRRAMEDIEPVRASAEVSVIVIGRRGRIALARLVPMLAAFTDISDRPTSADIVPIARMVIDGYLAGDFDEVQLVYPEFVNTLTQRPTAVRLLPVVLPEDTDPRDADVIFEPDPASVLEALVPRFIETELYQSLLELTASEQSARMVAMRAATENASDLIDALGLTYNKLRQAKITSEIIDIASGANALAQRA